MAVKYSSYSMIKRLLALIVLIAFFAVSVIFRLLYLQIFGGYNIIDKGLTEWLRDLPLIANRGSITDRNGVVLASSYTTYDLYVKIADVKDAEELSEMLSIELNLDKNDVYENITKKSYSEVRIAQNLEKEKVQKILKSYKNGIYFTTNTQRNYNFDSLLCQIIGFVSSDNIGQTGLESYYNSYLKGTNGVSLSEADLKGSTIEDSLSYYIDSIDGLNISLTIDYVIQSEIENIMTQAMIETGAKSVSCMVSKPQTGEILAVCSLPSYNLNNIPRDDISKLNELSRATTIVDTFEPGSTFKPIVTAIALEEGVTTEHSYFYCSGYRIINGVKIRCSRRSGHGSQSLEQGLMNSCNCVFMDLIGKIGVKKFYDYLEKFGFTSGLGLDFPGEVSAVLMPETSVTSPDLARMGFGQTIALSALHMVSGISTVINNGYVIQPHLINNISSNSEVLYTRSLTVKDKILSDNTSKIMREMMFSVVDKGGGKYAKVDGYPIVAGKTGTAQKYQNGKIAEGKYVGSFIGFAPYDNPEYVVYVIIDEPQGAYYGGVVAAPVASKIFSKIFEREDYLFQNAGQDSYNEFVMPTFVGLTLTESASYASSLGLQYLTDGTGDYVTSQIPAPGTVVKENDIVLLNFQGVKYETL